LKPSLIIFILLLLGFYTNAQQNLVLNGGFEDTLWCYPCGNGLLNKFPFVSNPTLTSPDGLHACCYNPLSFNPIRSRTGWGRVGFFVYQPPYINAREYVQMTIQDSLIKNKSYCYTSYFRTVNNCQYITSSVGVKFFNNQQFYNSINPILSTPDIQNPNTNLIDTTMFVAVKGLYTSGGGEKNIIVGNYLDDINSNLILKYPNSQVGYSYIMVDDISLVPTDIDLGNDMSICNESDSLLVGEPNWIETTYKWFANGILIDTLHGQLKIKPNSNTMYVVQKQTSCITTSDTLVVTYTGSCPVLPIDITEPIIPNVFTPNGDDVNEYWRITLPTGAKLKELEVYNRWGNIVFASEGTIKPWFGRTSSGEPCNEGVYFYVLKYSNIKGEEQKKNGYVSLFR
jgi:gliding motility-associated-like protein